jgi:dipeptidyl-peptidase 4
MARATVLTLFMAAGLALSAQDRLRSLPGYEQYQRMAPLLSGAWVSGAIAPRWNADSRAFTYALSGKTYRFDIGSLTAAEDTGTISGSGAGRRTASGTGAGRRASWSGGEDQAQMEMPRTPMQGCPASAIARGRQSFCEQSPDGARKAFVRDRNMWVANADGSGEVRLTSDGSQAGRIKYGLASWVYGEELAQTTAIWWSPDSRKLGFYRFDEREVKDYYVAMNQTGLQTVVDAEAYPKAGSSNPIPDVLVYTLDDQRTTVLDVRDGLPFDNHVVGHYVYNVHWRPDSAELLVNRANRRQQIVELARCAVPTGKCRRVVREEWPTGWVDTEGAPNARWLSDHQRFIWESSRSGWSNFYLYDINGRLLSTLTQNRFDADSVVKVDEAAGLVFYTARDGDNFLKLQLHRVGLDGRGDVRLTDPAFSHSAGTCTGATTPCGISPDNRFVVDVFQRHDVPTASQLIDGRDGHVLARIAASDTSRLESLGWRPSERFTYTAADGSTALSGQFDRPLNFDPARRYPVLVPVYGGPTAFGEVPTESFIPPNPMAEYGFLVARVMYRGVPGTGKRGADALYLKLGQTEVDDIAAGISTLAERTFVDRARIGIYGTSYGGYVAAMAVMRYPELFRAASASSPVTDWRNYDTIYTERYMWLPSENKAGYDAGSVMTYAKDLKGPLLLYYATADNNVHPGNSLQLVEALQREGKRAEIEVGPDLPHSSVSTQRRMDFFMEHLLAGK